MQRALRLAVVPACGAAIVAKPHGHFMALSQLNDSCSPDAYTGPSADGYRKACADIEAECDRAAGDLNGKHDANLAELKDECERQKRILAGKEEDHAGEVADVNAQEKVVGAESMDVTDARQKVKEYAQCRPELVQAKEALAEQEAIPNDASADIDAECDAKKLVMEKEECVQVLKAAESVLRKQKREHKGEVSELKGEESEAAAAASELPPQEEKVRIACQAYDDLKNKGPSQGGLDKLSASCQRKKDALLKQADQAIEDLLAEYLRQKKILGVKNDDHSDEKADVAAEEKDVAAEAQDVKEAKVAVVENEHCPPELAKAKDDLATQEGIPNDTSEDIDAECAAKKRVMEAEQCVEVLRRAEAVLSKQRADHREEKSELSGEVSEENRAAAAVPPQKKIVCELKAALDAARAARKALPCGGNCGRKDEKPAPAPAPAPEPEKKKSGASRASGVVAVVAVLMCALVQA